MEETGGDQQLRIRGSMLSGFWSEIISQHSMEYLDQFNTPGTFIQPILALQ